MEEESSRRGEMVFVLFLFRGVLFLPSCRPRDEFLFEFIELNFCKGTQIEDPKETGFETDIVNQQSFKGPSSKYFSTIH